MYEYLVSVVDLSTDFMRKKFGNANLPVMMKQKYIDDNHHRIPLRAATD